jgi:GNAT superfamily N-acetyltransferase
MDARFEKKVASNGKPYFNLQAANHQVIGTSPIYASDQARDAAIAEVDGKVYGFANCVVHENTWETQPVCYLEDLFVAPSARGHGIGAALIEWLRNAMRAEGWARLYWMTKEDNVQARKLYDRFSKADGFVRYQIRQR